MSLVIALIVMAFTVAGVLTGRRANKRYRDGIAVPTDYLLSGMLHGAAVGAGLVNIAYIALNHLG